MNKRLEAIKEYIERADYYNLELDGIEISMTNPQGLEVHRFNTADSALDDFLLNGVQDIEYLINEVERLQNTNKNLQNEAQKYFDMLIDEQLKVLRYEEALNFYANDDNWDTFESCIKIGNSMACKDTTKIEIDMGEIAQVTLDKNKN